METLTLSLLRRSGVFVENFKDIQNDKWILEKQRAE